MLTLESLLKRQGQIRFLLEIQTLKVDNLGASFYHEDTGTDKDHLKTSLHAINFGGLNTQQPIDTSSGNHRPKSHPRGDTSLPGRPLERVDAFPRSA